MNNEQNISHKEVYDRYNEFTRLYPNKHEMEIRKLAIEWAIGAHEIRFKAEPNEETIKKYCEYMGITQDYSTLKYMTYEKPPVQSDSSSLKDTSFGPSRGQKIFAYLLIGLGLMVLILIPILIVMGKLDIVAHPNFLIIFIAVPISILGGFRILRATSSDIQMGGWIWNLGKEKY